MSTDIAVDTLVNGRQRDQIVATDRGLLFGDGVFETMGFYRGKCPLWTLHMARLQRGCLALGLETPDFDLLRRECETVIENCTRAVVRLTVTRGSGGRGYWPDATESGPTEQSRIVHRRAWPRGQEQAQNHGLNAMISSICLAEQSALAGLKHCNRIEQILAARECQRYAVDEAVLLDQVGHVAEAISSNLLLRSDGLWRAPSSPAAVAGVGLEWLVASAPISIETDVLDLNDLRQADSILVINSVLGIRPLRKIDERELIVDADCRRLQSHWNHHLIPPCDV